MKKNCVVCGVEFEARQSNHITCSKKCCSLRQKASEKKCKQTAEYKAYEKARRQTPERKDYQKQYGKIYKQTPKYKAYLETPEHKIYEKEYNKEYQKTPIRKAYEKTRGQTPECKAYRCNLWRNKNKLSNIKQFQNLTKELKNVTNN